MTTTPSQQLETFIDGLKLRHFRGAEFTPFWDNVYRGVRNSVPPEALWPDIVPTLTVLDALREALGAPIVLTSTYRNSAYNHAVGGTPQSQHVHFRAVDFRCVEGRPDDWADVLYAMRGQEFETGDGRPFTFLGGVGVYPTRGFVHLDTRRRDADWRGV